MEHSNVQQANHVDSWRHTEMPRKESIGKAIKDVVFLTLTFFSLYMLLFLVFDLVVTLSR